MRCLADNGRLLEIGKYDILKGTPLSMRPMLRNVAFEGIDLDRITNDPCNIAEVRMLSSKHDLCTCAFETAAHHLQGRSKDLYLGPHAKAGQHIDMF